MSARDDYPALVKWAGYRFAQADAERALDEIDELRLKVAWLENIAEGRGEENERLRQWKREAMAVLGEWEQVWEAAGKPGRLGSSKAAAIRELLTGSVVGVGLTVPPDAVPTHEVEL